MSSPVYISFLVNRITGSKQKKRQKKMSLIGLKKSLIVKLCYFVKNSNNILQKKLFKFWLFYAKLSNEFDLILFLNNDL